MDLVVVSGAGGAAPVADGRREFVPTVLLPAPAGDSCCWRLLVVLVVRVLLLLLPVLPVLVTLLPLLPPLAVPRCRGGPPPLPALVADAADRMLLSLPDLWNALCRIRSSIPSGLFRLPREDRVDEAVDRASDETDTPSSSSLLLSPTSRSLPPPPTFCCRCR